jgi:transposase
MRQVIDRGIPEIDDPSRLPAVTAVGVDETAYLRANATRLSRVRLCGRPVSCGSWSRRSLIIMARPPVFPAEEKVRIVLSILAGEITVAEAARRAKVSEQSVGNWKRQFLEAGKSGLTAGRSGSSTREQQLEAEVSELTQALGEAAVELRVWKKSAEGRLGPSRTSR